MGSFRDMPGWLGPWGKVRTSRAADPETPSTTTFGRTKSVQKKRWDQPSIWAVRCWFETWCILYLVVILQNIFFDFFTLKIGERFRFSGACSIFFKKTGGFHQLVTSAFLPEQPLEPEELRHRLVTGLHILFWIFWNPENFGSSWTVLRIFFNVWFNDQLVGYLGIFLHP